MRRTRWTAAAAVLAAAANVLPALSTSPAAVADQVGPVDTDAPVVARQAEPVVLTGVDLPDWSRLPATGQPATYPGGTDDQNQVGDEVRSAHHGTLVVPEDPRDATNVAVDTIAAYRWSGSGWVEVPVQVDERFPYFLANARSTFSVYSGVDTELTYAWNPDAHADGEEAWKKVAGDCIARYATADELAYYTSQDSSDEKGPIITPGQGETAEDYLGAMTDPVEGFDDDDEVVFLASDAGPAAPVDAAAPGEADAASRHEVALYDPVTGERSYVYLFTQPGGSSFTHENGYVQHTRHDSADWWTDRDAWSADDPEKIGTSNTNYGPNLEGTACVEADGTEYAMTEPHESDDRFPLDGMTIRTDAYEYTATGRWMSRGVRVARPDAPATTPGILLEDRLTSDRYGDDLVDRWKGRAFQQSPDSEISLVGFEDEQVNWEANSALLGWRSGPVRTIREIWGADSGTNVTKTETFYRDGVQHLYHLRVHPIPPDGLYTSWDYNRDTAACYYNAVTTVAHADDADCPGGVVVDGVNDEQVGNIDGFDYNLDGSVDVPFYFDAPDPTLSEPLAFKRWEQVSGTDDNGSLVYQFELEGETTLENPLIVPYYRDDACLDDGTGDDPVARPWPGENSSDDRVTGGYSDLNGDGEIRCEDGETQGAHAAHGVHFFFTHDTDNAFLGTPVATTEVVGSQWQFAVPTASPQPVGERYSEMLRAPLVPLVTAQGPATDQLDSEPTGVLRAGVAKVDSTWHVGSAAGQYAGKNVGMVDYHNDMGVDPHGHSTSSEASYGIQGREWVRALVVDGADGERFAVVSNDLYIPQDLVNQRVATILADHDARVAAGLEDGPITGITIDNLTVSVSHSHSSPFHSSTTWGPWVFEDVFDIRFFEHIAQKMADAVIEAAGDVQPVRVGAAESSFRLIKRHSYGPEIGEAGSTPGTPAGYHFSDIDDSIAVVAFDRVDTGEPLATWVVWGEHPEMLDGNDLLASEWWNTTERVVDRELGGVTLFSQRDTGSSETGKGAEHFDPQLRQEFSHREYAQVERAARLVADAVTSTRDAIDGLDAEIPTDRLGRPVVDVIEDTLVPFTTDAPIGVTSVRFAPPGAQASPEVSNCNTGAAYEYTPGVPVLGLPDCQFLPDNPASQALREAVDPRVMVDTLEAAGIPVPADYGFPSWTALQETAAPRLQAMRIGDIAITVCPCEQFADQSRNIVARLNEVDGDLWFGFDWTANPLFTEGFERGVRYDGEHGPLQLPFVADEYFPAFAERGLDVPDFWCLPLDADGNELATGPDGAPAEGDAAQWRCLNPKWQESPWLDARSNDQRWLAPVSDRVFRTMKAQIYNDAAGWDTALNSAQAESEPSDPSQIWGNFTHEELADVMPEGGYRMVLPVGMSNDYFGYTVSYREFRAHDHYRKALTGLGPHGQDFFATRLTRLAATLRGAEDLVPYTAKDELYATVEQARQEQFARGIGATAAAYLPLYEARLPADGGAPALLNQPGDIGWFDAAQISWIGGSNYTDTPEARVERWDEAAQAWVPYADGEGEVQVMVDFPQAEELPLYAAGQYAWTWTATFEAFASDIPLPDATGVRRTATPPGTYRFVVEGCHRGLMPDLTAGADGACSTHDVAGRATPYQLTSEPFEVSRYQGVSLDLLRIDEDGQVFLEVGPAATALHETNTEELHRVETDEGTELASHGAIGLPTSYASPFDVIDDGAEVRSYRGGTTADDERFCFHCSFRPWAQTDQVRHVTVTVSKNKRSETLTVPYDPLTGQLALVVKRNTTVTIEPGALLTALGTDTLDRVELTRPPQGSAETSGEDVVGAADSTLLEDTGLIEWAQLYSGALVTDLDLLADRFEPYALI